MALATKPKPPASQKKHTGQHHRHNKHYLKTYWPYIPMLLVVGLGIVCNSLWRTSAVLGASSDFSNQTLLDSTNQDRATAHLPSLTIDPKLQAAAQAKAQDMAQQDYWAHTSPTGKTPWTFITASGYQYQAAGENLAYGFDSASAAVAGWMNSPEHRANILNNHYTNVGFGVVNSLNFLGRGPTVIVVAEYATPVSDVANITFNVNNTSTTKVQAAPNQVAQEPSSRLVSHVAIVDNGQATWLVVLVSAITGAAVALFVISHGLRLRRLLLEGERFVVHHPLLDIAFVGIATTGFVVSQAAGVIR